MTQCACGAVGPTSLLGSGNLLRGDTSSQEFGAQPCADDTDCGGVLGSHLCRDAVHCSAENFTAMQCPDCSTDVTLNRTDPRVRDTDADGVTDSDEVFGYLTGAGIVDPERQQCDPGWRRPEGRYRGLPAELLR